LWIVIYPGRAALPAEAAATLRHAGLHLWPAGTALLVRRVGVAEPRYVGAAVRAQLRLDPTDGGAIVVGTLSTVTKARELLDGRLVPLEIQSGHELSRRVVG